MRAAAGAQFPGHVAALRAPNLLYAAVTLCAIVLLGFEMGGAVVAWFAGLVSATFLLALQVASWLATDAPLMAGVALAMLGFFAGLNATLAGETRRRARDGCALWRWRSKGGD